MPSVMTRWLMTGTGAPGRVLGEDEEAGPFEGAVTQHDRALPVGGKVHR
jgi:hypothetical protein